MTSTNARALVAICVLCLALATGAPPALAQNGQPVPMHVIFPAQRLQDQTAYSASPQITRPGVDITRVIAYDQADIFVTAFGEPGFSLKTTVEFSADGESWAPLHVEALAGGRVSVLDVTRRQTANGVAYLQATPAGVYLRVKLEATGTVTPTVRAIYKNSDF
jgi:hypothetical protein